MPSIFPSQLASPWDFVSHDGCPGVGVRDEGEGVGDFGGVIVGVGDLAGLAVGAGPPDGVAVGEAGWVTEVPMVKWSVNAPSVPR